MGWGGDVSYYSDIIKIILKWSDLTYRYHATWKTFERYLYRPMRTGTLPPNALTATKSVIKRSTSNSPSFRTFPAAKARQTSSPSANSVKE